VVDAGLAAGRDVRVGLEDTIIGRERLPGAEQRRPSRNDNRPGPMTRAMARVREALERVLGDGAFRAAAEEVRAEIAAMPAPEAVVAELERRYAP
jgi:hypothetical protein